MTIITERPYDLSFSENEIRYILNVDDTTTPGCEVQVEVHFMPADLSADIKIITVSVTPNPDGNIYFHVKSYLKSLVTLQMPDPAGAVVQPVADQMKYFYIRYREVSKGVINPDWTDDINNKRIVLLGGVEQMKFRRNNFFANYLVQQPGFLTWQPSGKRVFRDQEHYLTLLLTQSVSSFTVNVKTVFADLTETSKSYPTSVGANSTKVWRIKSGMAALGLQNASSKIYYYEVSATSGGTTLAAAYRFYVDYNMFYDYHDFNYGNSLGGVDCARLQGQFNWNIAVTADDIEQVSDKEDYASAFPTSQYSQSNLLKRDSYKGDIGWSRTQMHQETLIELLVSKGIFENIGGRWIRIINLTKSQDLRTNTDKKWSFALEWNYGYTDAVFTPKSINLGGGAAQAPPPPPPPPPPTCVAVTLPSVQLPDGVVGTPYSYSISLGGTAPFGLVNKVESSGITIALSGSVVNITGTPNTAGTNITISFTVTNCSGSSANFSDTIDIAAAQQPPTGFGSTTFVSGDASNDVERVDLVGVPGSTLTITLTTYTNNNGGQLLAQGSIAYQDNTFKVVMDANGHGTFSASIQGNPNNTGTVIRGIFTITSASAGTIGNANTFQISKVF